MAASQDKVYGLQSAFFGGEYLKPVLPHKAIHCYSSQIYTMARSDGFLTDVPGTVYLVDGARKPLLTLTQSSQYPKLHNIYALRVIMDKKISFLFRSLRTRWRTLWSDSINRL